MKSIKWIFIIFIILIVIIVACLGYLGFFSKIPVVEKEMGPYIIAYEHIVGPYKDTGKIFMKIWKSLASDKIKTMQSLGLYYDDPRVIAPDKCRSDCGIIIAEKDLAKVMTLKKYNIKTINKQFSIVSEIPMKNMMSMIIGPMIGYPAIMKYAKEKSVKWAKNMIPMELYDMQAKKIYYIMGVVK